MRSLACGVIFVPAVVLAQPGDAPTVPPAPPAQPGPEAPSASIPPPRPPPESWQQPALPPPIADSRRGFTAEVNAGLGLFKEPSFTRFEFLRGVSGLDLGAGAFLAPWIALSLRASGATYYDNGPWYLGVVAPNLQLWVSPQLWVGGGLGLGVRLGCGTGGCGGTQGTGYVARVGYSLIRATTSPNVSLEWTSVELGNRVTYSTIGVLAGLQYF